MLLCLCMMNKYWHCEIRQMIDWMVVEFAKVDKVEYLQYANQRGLSMKSIYYCYLNDLLAFKYMFGEELLYILGHEEEIKNINI